MNHIRKFFINMFIGGLIVLLPIIVVIQIFKWFFSIFEEGSRPLTNYLMSLYSMSDTTAIMFSMISVFAVLSVIGMLVRTKIGNGLYQFFEQHILFRVPGYKAIKEITDQISGKQKGLFRKVVLVNLADKGVSVTGFVVDEIGDTHSTVFVPCGPNPTTGFIYHVNNTEITDVDVSIETAMKTVISCGSGSAQFISPMKL